jgi:uncharacterized protein YjiS (DUF1127 family)
MSCPAESRREPDKNRFTSRLASIASSSRVANRDRRLLLALDDRMLGDIGLAREDLLPGRLLRSKENLHPQASAWGASVWTVIVVIVSLLVVLIAPDGSKVDPLKVASCAVFPRGMISGRNEGGVNKHCRPYPYGGCRQIIGAPKHGC